ncbi:MAG: sigma 54-interacting transcriptional regulator [Myxococcota bacterium]
MTTTHTVTLSRDAEGEVAVYEPLRLNVVAGPDAGARVVLRRDTLVIGTHESADLRLTDDTVSRFHCELAREQGRLAVRDLGSRNGTSIDGVQVERAWAEPGQRLTLGRTTLELTKGEAGESARVPLGRERFGALVGRSVAMRTAFSLLERAAASDATVLLEGETGTGKEGAAEGIHEASARAKRPFVVVDCGAIPPQLLESELFGHERGAFTGAVARREGAFEAARGGTVFLDEVGELPAELQPRLLRVLERREVKPVGATHYLPVDVRIIAATHRALRAEVNSKSFRADLYYRLAVLVVRLPALRERADDLPLLVEALLEQLHASTLPEAAAVRAPETLERLARHAWPGNVRELRNWVERSLALREPPALESAAEAAASPTATLDLKDARARASLQFERQYLEDMLARTGNNVAKAAREAGVDRKYFYRLLYRHGLR